MVESKWIRKVSLRFQQNQFPQMTLQTREESVVFDEARLQQHESLFLFISSSRPVSVCGFDGKPRRRTVKRRHRVLLFWESNEASRLHRVECCSIIVDYLLNINVSCLKMSVVLLSRVWPRISPGRVSGHRNQVFGLAQCQQPQQYAQRLPCRGHQPEGAASIPVLSAGAVAPVRSCSNAETVSLHIQNISFKLERFPVLSPQKNFKVFDFICIKTTEQKFWKTIFYSWWMQQGSELVFVPQLSWILLCIAPNLNS